MRKKISDKTKVLVAFLVLLVVAIVSDLTKEDLLKDGLIDRGKIGSEKKEIQLQLDIGKLLEDYDYFLEVSPKAPTQEEAESYFTESIAMIDQDFVSVKSEVPLKKNYLQGAVKASWSFQPFGIIDEDGKVNAEKIEGKEIRMEAQVKLTCGAYKKIYEFPFLLKAPERTEEESLLIEIKKYLEQQMLTEGTTELELPDKIEGKSLKWSEKKEYISPQILLLEVVTLCLLWVVSKRRRTEEEKKRILQMELEYPDIVNQLALLLGSGMTTRQAWNRLAAQYSFKKSKGMVTEKMVYEAIIRMNGRFGEGESERMAYQKFIEEIPAPCYRKLMRILLGNLEKGTQGIHVRLEEESRWAFEQKILQAKKQGEETSTKMMIPLMLMMSIVMGIVILPALIQFQI